MTNEICKHCGYDRYEAAHQDFRLADAHNFEPLENHTQREQRATHESVHSSVNEIKHVPCETLADKIKSKNSINYNGTKMNKFVYVKDIKTALKQLKNDLSNGDYLFWIKVRKYFGSLADE